MHACRVLPVSQSWLQQYPLIKWTGKYPQNNRGVDEGTPLKDFFLKWGGQILHYSMHIANLCVLLHMCRPCNCTFLLFTEILQLFFFSSCFRVSANFTVQIYFYCCWGFIPASQLLKSTCCPMGFWAWHEAFEPRQCHSQRRQHQHLDIWACDKSWWSSLSLYRWKHRAVFSTQSVQW